MDQLVPLEILAYKVALGLLDQEVIQVPLVLLDLLVHRDLLAQLERRVLLASPDLRVPQGLQALRDQQGLQVLRVDQGLLVPQDRQDSLEHLGHLAPLGHRELQVPPDHWEPLVHLDLLGLQVT